MRLIAKSIFSLVVIVLAFAVIGSITLSLVLQSQYGKKHLQESLAGIFGVPVKVKRAFGVPPTSIRVNGVEAGIPGEPPFFTAESITLSPDYMALLHGQLMIAGITLRQPSLHLGKGVMSVPKNPLHQPSSPTTPVSAFVTTFQMQSPQIPLQIPESGNLSNQVRSLAPSLRSITITKGELVLLDEKGIPSVSISGLDLHGGSRGDVWNGILKASRVIFGNQLIIRNVESPVSFTNGMSSPSLSLNPIKATFGGGKLGGKVILDLSSTSPAYTLTLKLTGASLKELLTDASMDGSRADGVVTGALDLAGQIGKGSTMTGSGNLNCREAVIQPAGFLRQIGQLLQVEELQLLKVAEGKCLFRIDAGHLEIGDLMLRTDNLILAAKGPLHPSGELDLDSRLLFNEKLTGRLKGLLGSQFSVAPESGYSQIAFHVSGTVMSPKTDLLERLTGIRIGGDLGGLLQGLFGRPAPRTQPAPTVGGSSH